MSKKREYLDNDGPPQLWYIEWDDHSVAIDPGWHDLEKAEDFTWSEIMTVGWVIGEGDKSITIINTYSDEGHTGQPRCLLKSCITRAVRLKDPCKWVVEKE